MQTELDKKFEDRYKALNKHQKEAVDSIDGPVMVIAGPGTGKTTILTLRIANILKQTDTPPSGILALTFTDAGAKIMRIKLREIVGSRADEVRIHTFHSFAGSIISEYSEHFPHLYRSKQITEIDSESIIREILKDKQFSKLRPFGEPDFYVGKIISAIKDSKKEAWTPEIVKSFAKEEIDRIKNNPGSISSRGKSKGELKADALKKIERCEKTILLAQVYELYEKKKKEDRKTDFDDLIFELLLALREDKLLLQLLQEKFLYVLIDEHQDTNDSQNLIVALLSSFFESPNLFVVGDEKQAIYRFQGASVQNFLRFQSIWKNMKVIPLVSNYRSQEAILDSAFSLIENNYEDGEHQNLRVELKSESKHKSEPIKVISAGNTYAVDKYLIENLKDISKNEPDATVAVITRKNKEVEHVLSLCENEGIPASAERGADIFESSVGHLYFSLLEYLDDPTKVEALSHTLVAGLWGVSFKDSVETIKGLKSSTVDPEKVISGLKEIKELEKKSGVISFLILIAEISEFTKVVKDSPIASQIWRSIIDLAKSIAERGNIESGNKLIKELLSYRKSAETKSIKVGGGNMDANIHIMTAHSSKGLEYDYVFLPFAIEESWNRAFRGSSFVLPSERDSSDDIKDSRRLFYVAITRARKGVYIIVPVEDSLGKIFTPLRFIEEMGEKNISKVSIPKTKETPKLNVKNLENVRKQEMVEYSKRVLTENGLSVTALNHFQVCPRRFFYKSILKIPEAPNAISEKGIAMHDALSRVWSEDDRSSKNIEKIINDTVKRYFKTSLLSTFEKEPILDELLTSSKVVAKELSPYFSSHKNALTEIWRERTFETKVLKKDVVFNLHGQLDVLIESEKKVSVYDYKTTEAKTINEIRGDNKDSDGNYFRQLIFYKLLLSVDSRYKEKQIEPALIFVKPNKAGECPTVVLPITKEDENRVLDEIEGLVQSVWSGDFLEGKCEDKDCVYCKLGK